MYWYKNKKYKSSKGRETSVDFSTRAPPISDGSVQSRAEKLATGVGIQDNQPSNTRFDYAPSALTDLLFDDKMLPFLL
jgi:hypothetical protein